MDKQPHTPSDQSVHGNRGQSIIEYVIILALVGLAVVLIVNVMFPAIGDVFSRLVGDAPVAPPALSGYTPPPTYTPTETVDPNATPTNTPETPLPTNTLENTLTPTNTTTPTETTSPTVTNTPTFGSCEYQEVNGRVVIEAENYAAQQFGSGAAVNHYWVSTVSYTGYNGTSALEALPNNGVNTDMGLNGPRMDYDVRIQTPGDYYMYVRALAPSPSPGGNDSVHTGFNGSAFTLEGTGFTDFVDSGFTWQRWGTAVTISDPGQYTFNVWMREDGAVVDRVMLSTNPGELSNGSTAVGPAQSNAPGGCSGAPTPAPTATPTITPTPGPDCAPTGDEYVKINFQPANASVPSGYFADSGAAFGNRGNGFTYGWDDENDETRDRNNGDSPDQRHDTLNHMQKGNDNYWEIAVENGRYEICIAAGDPNHTDSDYRINVEGSLAINHNPSNDERWGYGFVTVDVTDGRLSITNASGADNNKINFVDIYAIDVPTPTHTPTLTPTPEPVEVIIDNGHSSGVTINGNWQTRSDLTGYYTSDYLMDLDNQKGRKSVIFTPNIPASGVYEVYMWWPADNGNASNVPVEINHASDTDNLTVNQRQNGGQWVYLGEYSFNTGTAGTVTIRTDDTNGLVIADAVRFYKP